MEERDKETELQRPMEPAEEEVAGEEKQGKREKGSLASDLFDWAEALVYALALLVVQYSDQPNLSGAAYLSFLILAANLLARAAAALVRRLVRR